MKYAAIENGQVVNLVIAQHPLDPGWVAVSDEVEIGWLHSAGQLAPPPLRETRPANALPTPAQALRLAEAAARAAGMSAAEIEAAKAE